MDIALAKPDAKKILQRVICSCFINQTIKKKQFQKTNKYSRLQNVPTIVIKMQQFFFRISVVFSA